MWPNLFVADFNLEDMFCYVTEIDFLFEKGWPAWILSNLPVADIDLVNMVCGRYGIDP